MFQFDKPDNLVSLIEEAVAKYPNNKLFGIKNKKTKEYHWTTYQEIGQRVDNLRGGLAKIGLKKDEVVGVIANNRPEWAIAAFATYGCGGRFIPMYEAELEKVWEYIIKDGLVKILLVSNKEIYEKIKDFPKKIETLEKIYIIDDDSEISMTALEKIGAASPVKAIQPSPNDIAALIYTSGTTGDPKGVLLSHGNFTSNAQAGRKIYPELDENARSLSILPWAHSYGQTAELYNWFLFGGSIGFMEDVTTLVEDFSLVQPSFLIAVPRVFNKVYEGICTKMEEKGGLAKALFTMGTSSAKKLRALEEKEKSSLIETIKYKIADKIVFSKIREMMGGRLKGALTASAMMNVEIAQFFFDIGIPVYDAYGLSETSPAVTMNCSANYKLGSVGKPVEKVKVVIDKSVVGEGSQDGEIVVYGPNVMQGYHNKPKETAEVMTKDGGFRTGDRGRLDEDGFLFITGRIKEQYKLENGKYVFPASLEEDIKLISSVANAMIYGEGHKYNVCLIVPDFVALEKTIKELNLPNDPKAIIANQEIKNKIEAEISEHLRKKYGGYEIPKKFAYATEDFTTENGMLTQTMKPKRRVILAKYKKEIDSLYE